LGPAMQGDPLLHDPAVVEQHHAGLDPRCAVRNLREVAHAELLLFREPLVALGHAERAVIGRNDLQVVSCEPLPKLVLMPTLAERRAHDVLRSVETWLVVVVDRETEGLRARLGIRRQAAVAEGPDLLDLLRRGR